jgi:hypothetical protein
MTELTFLIDLLLNHKLSKVSRDAVAARIKDVESGLGALGPRPQQLSAAPTLVNIPPHLVGQSPSTIAALMRQEQAGAAPVGVPVLQELNGGPILPPPPAAPTAPAGIAQTPAAQAAMNARAATIGQAVSGKPDKGQTSPRKW